MHHDGRLASGNENLVSIESGGAAREVTSGGVDVRLQLTCPLHRRVAMLEDEGSSGRRQRVVVGDEDRNGVRGDRRTGGDRCEIAAGDVRIDERHMTTTNSFGEASALDR